MTNKNIMLYNNVSDFLADCDKPVGASWVGKTRYSQEVDQNSFCGGASYNQAKKMAVHGWPEGLKKMTDKISSAATNAGPQNLNVKAIAGHSPDVARFIAGVPDCMNRKIMTNARRKPCLDIVVCGGFSGDVGAEQIMNYGAAVVSVIDGLELAGYSLSVIVGSIVDFSSITSGAFVRLKNHGEHLDLGRLAFFVAHPASLRRLRFAHREVFVSHNEVGSGYGRSIDLTAEDMPRDLYFPKHTSNGGIISCGTFAGAMRYVTGIVKKQMPELVQEAA